MQTFTKYLHRRILETSKELGHAVNRFIITVQSAERNAKPQETMHKSYSYLIYKKIRETLMENSTNHKTRYNLFRSKLTKRSRNILVLYPSMISLCVKLRIALISKQIIWGGGEDRIKKKHSYLVNTQDKILNNSKEAEEDFKNFVPELVRLP